MKDEKAGTGLTLFVAAMSLPMSLWLGYVESTMWRWFVVPLGLPQIGIAQCLGLTILVALVVKDWAKPPAPGFVVTTLWMWQRLLLWAIGPAISLGVGRLWLYFSTF